MTVEKIVHPDTTKRILDQFNIALGQKLGGSGMRVSFGEMSEGVYVYQAHSGSGLLLCRATVQIIGLQASWRIS